MIKQFGRASLTVLLLASVLATVDSVIASQRAWANDSTGYRYGTDTSCGESTGSAPYGNDYNGEPCDSNTADFGGGVSGGYMGQSGGYENTVGCTYSPTINSQQWANSITNFHDGYGFGVGLYFLEGGPGADPIYYTDYEHGFTPPTYTYTTTDAYNWGYDQGQDAVNAFNFWNDYYPSDIVPIVFLDAEYDFGWNEILADTNAPSCGGIVNTSNCCTTSLDRQTFDGFTDAVTATRLTKGAYSSYDFWNLTTFACGSCTSGDGYIPHTDQWTAGTTGANGPADPGDSPAPGQDDASAWCIHNTPNDNCAGWFGDVNSSYEVAWQWSEKAWTGNGVADFDQWNESGMDGT